LLFFYIFFPWRNKEERKELGDDMMSTDSRIIIVGMDNGPLEEAMLKRIEDFGPDTGVYYYGYQPNKINPSLGLSVTKPDLLLKMDAALGIILTEHINRKGDADIIKKLGLLDEYSLLMTGDWDDHIINFAVVDFLYFDTTLLEKMKNIEQENDTGDNCELDTIINSVITFEDVESLRKEISGFTERKDKRIGSLKRKAYMVAHALMLWVSSNTTYDTLHNDLLEEIDQIDTSVPFYHQLLPVFNVVYYAQSLILREIILKIFAPANAPDITKFIVLERTIIAEHLFELMEDDPVPFFTDLAFLKPNDTEVFGVSPFKNYIPSTGYVERLMVKFNREFDKNVIQSALKYL